MASEATRTNLAPYEAGSNGPRLISWSPTSAGPNLTVGSNLYTLRNRSRHEERNNPWMGGGISRIVSNEIGIGIHPRSKALDESIRDEIDALWAQSERQFDADGVTNIYGLQTLGAQARRVSGEVFYRRRPRRRDSNLAVPLQVQILESDYVPYHMNRTLTNGRYILHGIEFDSRGQKLAYHMYPKHPGDLRMGSTITSNQTTRVPANQVIHHFIPVRPGQVRGTVENAQSLLSAKELREYSDAEMMRKKTRAPFTGMIIRETNGEGLAYDPISGASLEATINPLTGESLAPPPVDVPPGTFMVGQPGEKMELFPSDESEGYGEYFSWKVREMAAGMNVPYEILSGDWSKVNDRLVRVILNQFQRGIESLQDQFIIPQVCCQIWDWWITWAVFTGRLNLPDFAQNRNDYAACAWQPHAWPYVHPEQDIKAAVMAVNADISSASQEASKRGRDIQDNIRENAQYRKARKEIFEEEGVDDEGDTLSTGSTAKAGAPAKNDVADKDDDTDENESE